MNWRKDMLEYEASRNIIPVSFIEEEMYKLRRSWILEEEPERQDDLELAYRVLDKLIQKWRKENE